MPSILIVDDEPNIRRMVGALLGAEGYEVRDASDAASGLARAVEYEPDLVLLDLMMPVMDGKAFLEALKKEAPEREKDLVIVVFSAGASISDPLVKGFLKKPVDIEAVLALINSGEISSKVSA